MQCPLSVVVFVSVYVFGTIGKGRRRWEKLTEATMNTNKGHTNRGHTPANTW
jgi:hypothetical protein